MHPKIQTLDLTGLDFAGMTVDFELGPKLREIIIEDVLNFPLELKTRGRAQNIAFELERY
jgi:hypothetical protein